MRTSGMFTVLASLLFCPALGAETNKPDPRADEAMALATAPGSDASSAVSTKRATSSADAASCSLTGTAIPDLDLEMADPDGRPLARFGGVALPLTIDELPTRADGKVRVTTGGHARVRVSGYVSARSIPLYLKRDVAVVQGHVTLLQGTAVEYSGRSGAQIRINVKTVNAIAETYSATVGCDALTVEAQSSHKWSPPAQTRGYLMKQSVAPLFDKPGTDAKPVSSIHLAPDARGVLFFGDRREGDFIHVLYRRDVGIDGWMSVKDLEILPRGELADQSVSKPKTAMDKKLRLKAQGQLYRASADIPLYGKADPKLQPIGTVTKDTELYVLEVMVGWANVLPRQLDVVPVEDKRFWVKASELGM